MGILSTLKIFFKSDKISKAIDIFKKKCAKEIMYSDKIVQT